MPCEKLISTNCVCEDCRPDLYTPAVPDPVAINLASADCKVESHVTRTYTLKMTEEMAEWLRNVMQNPLYGQEPLDENKQERRLREILWTELSREIG